MKITERIAPTVLWVVVVMVGLGAFPRAARAVTGSTTTLSAGGQDSITYGQSVLFTAVIASSNATGHPSGTVTLKSNGMMLATLAIVSDGPGSASARASYRTTGADLVTGMDTISADYSGDGNFLSSTKSRIETVSASPSYITSLTADTYPSKPGELVTFTASVYAGGNHVTGLGLMTGTVTFYDDVRTIATSSTFVADPAFTVYNVTFSTFDLLPGDHFITASYGGDDNNLASPEMTYYWTQTVLELTGLAIAGPDTVAEGNTRAYTATATWNDGSMGVVAANFSVSPAGGVSIAPGGLLTATLSAATGPVTVTAVYAAYGVTKTATRRVTITPTLVGLDLGGPGEVTGPGAATYAATATFGDDTTSVVTPVWSIAPGVFAAIAADGSLAASLVTAKQTESINASYTFDGVTRTATKVVDIVPFVLKADGGGPGDAGTLAPDATTGGPADAGRADAGTPPDAGPSTSSQGGCSEGGAPSASAGGTLALVGLALWILIRRRRTPGWAGRAGTDRGSSRP